VTVFYVCSVGDKIASVNGISCTNINHATAISVLKDSGQTVTLVRLLYASFVLVMMGRNNVLSYAVTSSVRNTHVNDIYCEL